MDPDESQGEIHGDTIKADFCVDVWETPRITSSGWKANLSCDNLREVNIWLVPWIQFHNPVLGNKVENRILHHWEAMSFFGLAVLVLGETVICDSYINRPAFRRGQAPFAHLRSLWLGTNEETQGKSSHAQHLLFLNASKLCCHLQNYKPQWSIYLS